MSPLQLQILLHYHCCVDDYPDLTPPAQQEFMHRFLRDGYLIRTDQYNQMNATGAKYKATEKLHFYCEALCNTPEPRQIWVCS